MQIVNQSAPSSLLCFAARRPDQGVRGGLGAVGLDSDHVERSGPRAASAASASTRRQYNIIFLLVTLASMIYYYVCVWIIIYSREYINMHMLLDYYQRIHTNTLL